MASPFLAFPGLYLIPWNPIHPGIVAMFIGGIATILNMVLVERIIQFRIEVPFELLFNVRNPGGTLRDVSESVIREVIGDRTVDEVLIIGRQDIESGAEVKLQDVVNKYEMGLSIDQFQLKNVNPPQPVQASFDRVNEAQQERERMINVARGEYSKAEPRAGVRRTSAFGSRGVMPFNG